MVPEQKPGRSKQDYATPADFITAVLARLGIPEFAFDFAADWSNAKAVDYFDRDMDALSFPFWERQLAGGWGWCNPPFSHIEPWARKSYECGFSGGSIALLVPAAVGSNWFRDYVDGKARVLLLNGRICFDPDHPTWGYPKDCILCLFGPQVVPGYEVWRWKN